MLFQRGYILSIDDHLCLSFVVWIPGLFKEFLIDIVLHVEDGGGYAVFMLVGGVIRVIGARLEERCDGIDKEED